MVEYPISFEAEAKSSKDEKTWSIETGEGLNEEISAPEEFGGDSEKPSPEDLLNASLTSCILATFKVTADRKGLSYSEVKTSSRAELDRNEDGRPVMKKAEVTITLENVSDNELAQEVVEISERNCFIHNSVKTDVETELEFTE